MAESQTGNDQAISEIPTQNIVYDSLAITKSSLPAVGTLTLNGGICKSKSP
ncbi:MAG: hypothetical protein PHH59_03160 [Methylovulum sp.]|uniref:hypothetical protein n=1 Tax=Methylovulum sp. TaxID=1916980 RepID=UPI002624A7FE|nr:hypothetical protein [Methylovulum sp.]MDD2723006.1 hypothetical protein [Methylovulum sp.]MDD5125216.1 hypothetical protein [Methylovulum sp.]